MWAVSRGRRCAIALWYTHSQEHAEQVKGRAEGQIQVAAVRSNPTEEQLLGFPLGQGIVQQLGVARGQGVWWRGPPGMGPARGIGLWSGRVDVFCRDPSREDSRNFCLHGCRNG